MPRTAFTLIELMIVVSIIAILAGMTVIGMGDIVHRARVQRSANSFVQACTMAQEMALANGRSYELAVNSAKSLVNTAMSISEYSDFWQENSTPGGVSGSVHTMSAPAEIWSDKPEDQWFAIIGPWLNSDGRWYQCRGGAGSEPFVDKNNNGIWNQVGEDFLDFPEYNRDTCVQLNSANNTRDTWNYWINVGGAFTTPGYTGYSFARYVFKNNTTNALTSSTSATVPAGTSAYGYMYRGEPYIDENGNGSWTNPYKDEPYDDLNGNGTCDNMGSGNSWALALEKQVGPRRFLERGTRWTTLFDAPEWGAMSTGGEPFTDSNGNKKWDPGEPYEDLNGTSNMDSPARSTLDIFKTCDPRFCGGRNAAWLTLAYQNALPAPITTGRTNAGNENARTTTLNFYPNGTIDRNVCPNVEVFASSGANFDQQTQAWVGICSTKTRAATFQPYRYYTSGAKNGQVEDYGTLITYQRPVAMLWISLSQAGDVVVGSSPRMSP